MISVSNSPHNSPLLVAKKKDGGWRVCLDLRAVNSNTVAENLPVPNIRTIFDRLGGAVWISVIDLKAGYLQTELSPESRKYTAFMTRRSKYEYNVVPFGLRGGVGHFCRLIDMIFGNLSYLCFYLDDLVLFSESFDEHCKNIVEVFELLVKNNLRANFEKCIFFAHEVKLLGHLISGKTIKSDPAKIEGILKRAPPNNLKDIQVFLGCTIGAL